MNIRPLKAGLISDSSQPISYNHQKWKVTQRKAPQILHQDEYTWIYSH